MNKFYLIFLYFFLSALSIHAQTNLIDFGSAWKYLDNGSNQGTVWRGIAFNDGTWKIGNGKFGYGISDAITNISYGTNANKKYITTYFRKSFTINNAALYSSYTANVKRDDGVAVYVNGIEVYRNNLPSGTLSYTTKATSASDNGTISKAFQINASAFVSGTNVIAVEIHQDKTNTPDMAFDLSLVGNPDLTAPSVNSINRQSPTATTTNATSVIYRVAFSEKVNGVDVSDFTATVVSGAVSGTVASVTAVGTIGDTYDVTVNSITGDGTLRLDLNGTGTGITDAAGNAINGGYSSGQTYIIDHTAPLVNSINRQSPITQNTSATSVTYRVTFSEMVTGVDASDFTATVVSGTVSGTVASVTAVGTTGDTYDVTISSITGSGTLRLDLNGTGTGITDAAGNSISGGYSSGDTYIIQAADLTAPVVNSINRQSPSTQTTSATSVIYRVTFSEMVTGVDASDFTSTVVSGTLSSTIASVAAVGTTGDIYDVTVSSITGDGTLRLDLNAAGTGITDAAGNAINGGYNSGQTYIIDHTAPVVNSINRQSPITDTTSLTSVTNRVTFSEMVTGVDASDFAATAVSGTVSGTVVSVTAVGTTGDIYDVTVSSITGSGTLRLDLKASGTGITDAASNAISGGYSSGQTYIIQSAILTNSSLKFNGTNSYVNLYNDSSLHLTSFTLEAWVKPLGTGVTSTSGNGGVIAVPIITKGRGEKETPANLNLKETTMSPRKHTPVDAQGNPIDEGALYATLDAHLCAGLAVTPGQLLRGDSEPVRTNPSLFVVAGLDSRTMAEAKAVRFPIVGVEHDNGITTDGTMPRPPALA